MNEPSHGRLNIRIEPGKHEDFYFWCRRHGRTMTEVCHLLIDAVLDGQIDLDALRESADVADLRDTQTDVLYDGL